MTILIKTMTFREMMMTIVISSMTFTEMMMTTVIITMTFMVMMVITDVEFVTNMKNGICVKYVWARQVKFSTRNIVSGDSFDFRLEMLLKVFTE